MAFVGGSAFTSFAGDVDVDVDDGGGGDRVGGDGFLNVQVGSLSLCCWGMDMA